MLLDEPTAAVDARTEATLLGLMHGWHGEGRTVIAVLHDLDLVAQHFPEALLLAREAVAWGRTAEVLTPENRMRARLAAEAWSEAPEICDAPHSHAA
jgi:zinc/manganese transport system ATP-binding protein